MAHAVPTDEAHEFRWAALTTLDLCDALMSTVAVIPENSSLNEIEPYDDSNLAVPGMEFSTNAGGEIEHE